MIKCNDIWLPDGEMHFVKWIADAPVVDGRGTYQYNKFQEALKWTKNRRVAVDVGAHVGLWSMRMAVLFEHVHSFEPIERLRECFRLNVQESNVTLHSVALGAKKQTVRMQYVVEHSGNSFVSRSLEGKPAPDGVPMETLDSFELEKVDLLKIDCEGYERFVLRGGRSTIKRCKPCVVVEQKPNQAQKFGEPEHGAVEDLQAMGAVLRRNMNGDFILSWD